MILPIVVLVVVLAVAYLVHKNITLAAIVADVEADLTQLKLDVSTELTKLKSEASEAKAVVADVAAKV
jgi:hypothetical protein